MLATGSRRAPATRSKCHKAAVSTIGVIWLFLHRPAPTLVRQGVVARHWSSWSINACVIRGRMWFFDVTSEHQFGDAVRRSPRPDIAQRLL
jgi:hypothetical protein